MKRTALRRLDRLEKRQPADPYAHLSPEELDQRLIGLYLQLVEEQGIDEVRATLARDFPETLRQLDELQAQGSFRHD